jgi:peptidoglycan/xylan/chitin deacetylase (PgdA/CDA1 family)
MKARNGAFFIISLDCEGLWGMADSVARLNRDHFRSEVLLTAYQRLLGLFAKYDIPATFAFVGAFCMSEAECATKLDRLKAVAQPWCQPFLADYERGAYEGWLLPEAAAAVKGDARHEIAAHGFSHLPLGRASATEVCNELEALQNVAAFKATPPRTFVFPRNQIGHLDLLEKAGFQAYRGALNHDSSPLRAKIRNVLSEILPFPSSATIPMRSKDNATIVEIPAGRFLNWRAGPRAKIPIAYTVSTWKHALQSAARHGGVVHLWSHPHNFVTGARMYEQLERILGVVNDVREKRSLEVVTQAGFVSTAVHEDCNLLSQNLFLSTL